MSSHAWENRNLVHLSQQTRRCGAVTAVALVLAGCGTTSDDTDAGGTNTGAVDTAGANDDTSGGGEDTVQDTGSVEDTGAAEDTGSTTGDTGSGTTDTVVGKCQRSVLPDVAEDQLGGFQTAVCDLDSGECRR